MMHWCSKYRQNVLDYETCNCQNKNNDMLSPEELENLYKQNLPAIVAERKRHAINEGVKYTLEQAAEIIGNQDDIDRMEIPSIHGASCVDIYYKLKELGYNVSISDGDEEYSDEFYLHFKLK